MTLTYAYGFAYEGAAVNASLVAPCESAVLSLIDQVKQFSNNVAGKPSYVPWTVTDSLFGVWIGVSDVGNSWWNSGETTLLGKIMDSYFFQLQILFNAEARNFVFLNIPRRYPGHGTLSPNYGALNTNLSPQWSTRPSRSHNACAIHIFPTRRGCCDQ